MADANRLKPIILRWEGGFAVVPGDRGGATNKGVTIGTFRQFFGADATVEQLKRMTDEQWMTVFRKGFWDKFRADEIRSQSVADICVDWAWNSGTKTAIRKVQMLLGVAADGIVGKKTLAAINAADPRQLFERVKAARLAFVEGIVSCNPSQRKFLNGWKNRINSFKFAE